MTGIERENIRVTPLCNAPPPCPAIIGRTPCARPVAYTVRASSAAFAEIRALQHSRGGGAFRRRYKPPPPPTTHCATLARYTPAGTSAHSPSVPELCSSPCSAVWGKVACRVSPSTAPAMPSRSQAAATHGRHQGRARLRNRASTSRPSRTRSYMTPGLRRSSRRPKKGRCRALCSEGFEEEEVSARGVPLPHSRHTHAPVAEQDAV
jgi:hypothetical protein